MSNGIKYLNKQTMLYQPFPCEQDDLAEFCEWWVNNRAFKPPYKSPLDFNGNLTGIVLFRDDIWQVQMFAVKPHSEIIGHVHPNVDTYEIYFSGHFVFTVNGLTLYSMEDTMHEVEGLPIGFGKAVRLGPTDHHAVEYGPEGGVFISVQKWLNNVLPTTVGDDWKEFGKENEEVKCYDKGSKGEPTGL